MELPNQINLLHIAMCQNIEIKMNSINFYANFNAQQKITRKKGRYNRKECVKKME